MAGAGGRYRQKVTGSPGTGIGPKTVYSVDKDYELSVWDSGSAAAGTMEERTFIGPSVTVLTKKTAAGVKTRSVRYRHVDRLDRLHRSAQADLPQHHGWRGSELQLGAQPRLPAGRQ